MKTNIFLLAVLFLVSCQTTKNTQQETEPLTQKEAKKSVQIYGYNFLIPESYIKIIDDVKAEDLKGNIRSRETAYEDPSKKATIHIILRPAPYGKTTYDYYLKLSYEKKAVLTEISGIQAIRFVENIKTDGKGHPLSNPIIREKYFILNSDQSCLEIDLNRYQNDMISAKMFKQFIKYIQR